MKYQDGRIIKHGLWVRSSAGLNEQSKSMVLIVTFRNIQKVIWFVFGSVFLEVEDLAVLKWLRHLPLHHQGQKITPNKQSETG